MGQLVLLRRFSCMLSVLALLACWPSWSWAAQCSDGIDNDFDGMVDYPADPGCQLGADNDEFDALPPPQGDIKAGGLLWYPKTSLGPQLLENPSFEATDTGGAQPLSWDRNGYEVDDRVSRTGRRSLRVKDIHLLQNGLRAANNLFLRKGVYRIAGWVKTERMAARQGSGARLCLSAKWPWGPNRGCTPLLKGTNDWKYLERSGIVITEDGFVDFGLEALGKPDGVAWFDDLELQEKGPLPLDVFLLYPNYRGMLFDDQSQTLKFEVRCNLASEGAPNTAFELNVIEESSGATVIRQSRPAGDFVVQADGSPLLNGRSYLARLQLVQAGQVVYEHPPYRIVKLSGGLRASMSMAFDEENRYLMRGKPVFLLGVYDSGLGYTLPEHAWRDQIFGQSRRLFELPINIYLNYWYSKTPAAPLKAMMNVLQAHDIVFLQAGNCFQSGFNTTSMAIHGEDHYVRDLGSHQGLAGYYLMDECAAELAPQVFERARRLRALDPDGITFGTSNKPTDLFAWRDTIDTVATDPYPIIGAEPPEGYNLGGVADWTAQARESVKGSRPVSTVLQFFQATASSPWPTAQQLRNMSYMAIAEGANGLFFWSLGVRALAHSCNPTSDWCDERRRRFEDLKTVMNEIKALEPVLVSLDRPELLAANSNKNGIRTRVKFDGEQAYLFASNVTSAPAAATFLWARPLRAVSLHHGGPVEFSGSSFQAALGPFEARVYAVSLSPDRAFRSRR